MTRGEVYRTRERSPERGPSAVRCDFLALLFKRKLSTLVGTLPPSKLRELDGALGVALDLA